MKCTTNSRPDKSPKAKTLDRGWGGFVRLPPEHGADSVSEQSGGSSWPPSADPLSRPGPP